MTTRKIPMRMCIVCKSMRPKSELIRIVRKLDGAFTVDFSNKANGRGAYLCNDIECIKKCVKARLLNKSFKCAISDEVYQQLLEEYVNESK